MIPNRDVMPAEAGVQHAAAEGPSPGVGAFFWTSAFAGMTGKMGMRYYDTA